MLKDVATGAFLLKVFGVVLLLYFLLLMWQYSWMLMSREMLDDPDLGKRGLFGDSFGAINALFSGLALGGVIIAIMMQRTELKLQREEMKASNESQQLQTKEFEEQVTQMQLHQFENHFFQLLNSWVKARDTVAWEIRGMGPAGPNVRLIFGVEAISKMSNIISSGIDATAASIGGKDGYSSVNIEDIAQRFYLAHGNTVNSYMSLWMCLMLFINTSPVLYDLDKTVWKRRQSSYIDIVKAHMAQCELELLGYWGICRSEILDVIGDCEMLIRIDRRVPAIKHLTEKYYPLRREGVSPN